MVFVLFASLSLILLTLFWINKKELVSPSVIFVLPFFLMCFIAILNYKTWQLEDFSPLTLLIILLGIFSYLFGCYAFKSLFGKNKGNIQNSTKIFRPSKCHMIITLFIEILASSLYLLLMILWGQQRGLSLSEAIFESMYIGKFNTGEEALDLPFYIQSLVICESALAYIYITLFCYQIVYKRRRGTILMLLNILIPFFTSFLGGSRGDALNYLIAFFVILILIYLKKYNFKKPISLKIIFATILIGCIGMYAFFNLKDLIGREVSDNYSMWDDFCVYIGAQVKNFDVYIKNYNFHSQHFGYSTFSGIYSILNNYLKFNIVEDNPSFSFVFISGKSLGNVYTCFYSYYIDAGIIGVILFSYLQGFTIQYFYNKARNASMEKFNLWIPIYGMFIGHIFFSFFGARYFSNVLSASTIRTVVWMLITMWFFNRFKFIENVNLNCNNLKGINCYGIRSSNSNL